MECGVSYLRPAIARGNVTVRTGALVRRVNFEGRRAVGVEVTVGAQVETLRATREVILSGGVINSPQLLMLSGIGQAAQLRRHGIEVAVDLPEWVKICRITSSAMCGGGARARPDPYIARYGWTASASIFCAHGFSVPGFRAKSRQPRSGSCEPGLNWSCPTPCSCSPRRQ